MKDEDDWRSSFRGIVDEAQEVFESYASLDNPNIKPEDFFGLDFAQIEEFEQSDGEGDEEEMRRPEFPRDESTRTLTTEASTIHEDIVWTPNLVKPVNAISSSQGNNSAANESTKPRRPLSAYNLFFQLERQRLIAGVPPDAPFTAEDVERVAIERREQDANGKPKRKHRKSHGKISFAELARKIANKWKTLNPDLKDLLRERAAIEKARYLRELEAWTKTTNEAQTQEFNHKLMAAQQPVDLPSEPPMAPFAPQAGPFNFRDRFARSDSAWSVASSPANLMPRNSPTPHHPVMRSNSFRGIDTMARHKYSFFDDKRAVEAEALAMAERTGLQPAKIMELFQQLELQEHEQQQQPPYYDIQFTPSTPVSPMNTRSIMDPMMLPRMFH